MDDHTRNPSKPDQVQQEITHSLGLEATADFSIFSDFTMDRWCQWIKAFLDYQPTDPEISVGRSEPHHVMLRLYEGLKSKVAQERFATALTQVFETTLPIQQNAEQLFYLIEIISYLLPHQAKRIARRLLFDRLLEGVEYANRDLHMMLLVANSEYDFDDSLAYFVNRSTEGETNYVRLLVYFRLLSRRSGEEAWPFLERIVPDLQRGPKYLQLKRVLGDVIDRVGYKSLLEWYVDKIDLCMSRFGDQMKLFQELLRRDVLSPKYRGSDRYLALLSGTLFASEMFYDPEHLVYLASLRPWVSSTLIARVLEIIWSAGESAGYGKPWDLLYPDNPILQKRAGHYAVVNKEGTAFLDPQKPSDLEVIDLLQQMAA